MWSGRANVDQLLRRKHKNYFEKKVVNSKQVLLFTFIDIVVIYISCATLI